MAQQIRAKCSGAQRSRGQSSFGKPEHGHFCLRLRSEILGQLVTSGDVRRVSTADGDGGLSNYWCLGGLKDDLCVRAHKVQHRDKLQ